MPEVAQELQDTPDSHDSGQSQLSAVPHQCHGASSLLLLASRSTDSSLVSREATDKEEAHTSGECRSVSRSMPGCGGGSDGDSGGGSGGGGRGKSPVWHATRPAPLRDDADTYDEDEEDFIRNLAMQDFKDEARGRPAFALQQLPWSPTLSGTLLPQSLPLSPPPPAAAGPVMEICSSAGQHADAPFDHPPPGGNTSIAQSSSMDADSSSSIWSAAWRQLVDAVRRRELNTRADECRRRFDLLHAVLGDTSPECL